MPLQGHMNGKFSKRLPPKTCLSCKGAVGAGRPVNPIHGLKFLEGETDFAFEGILPLVWSRSYYSDQDGTGWLGEGWSVPGCQRIIRDAAGLAYIDDQGRLFPLPEVDEDDEEPVLFESEQIWFSKNPDGHYVIASLDGSIALRFAPLVVAEDGSDEDSTLFPLVAVEDANGNHQRFVYHPLTGLPQYVIDGNGRVFSLNFGNVADEQSPKMRLLSVSLLEGLPAFGETARIGNLVRAANRLKTYNGTTYYYDELGNLIHRELADGEVQNYFYDLHDQLVKAEIFKKDGTKETWAYTYDALGRRIGKGRLKNEEVSDGLEEETGFVWDGSHLLQEVHPDGRYTYIYTDPDSYEPLAQVHNWTNEEGESRQQTHYFHCDQIGIPREMTDEDGNLLWFGNYTGWGKLKSETNISGTAHQPFRLQNQYADRETGLHYNFFRYYEPDAGRFVNQDPIGLWGGFNVYQFAPNVQDWVDPLGLSKCSSRSKTPNPYQGVKKASKYLKSQGVPRKYRKQILESFDRETIKVRSAGTSEYGLRYFDGINAQAKGRYLFETFPATRSSLTVKPKWNLMTNIAQFKVKPGTTIIEGKAAPQGLGLPGGQTQKYINDLERLIRQ